MNEKKESNASESIRLQLAIARAGVASRRHAEELIRDGLVRVNGKIITEMGTRVNPSTDKIEVEGRPLPAAPRRHWMRAGADVSRFASTRSPSRETASVLPSPSVTTSRWLAPRKAGD